MRYEVEVGVLLYSKAVVVCATFGDMKRVDEIGMNRHFDRRHRGHF